MYIYHQSSFKDLGVIMDSCLTYSDGIFNKTNKMLGFVKRQEFSVFFTHYWFDQYCSIIWNHYYVVQFDKIEEIQRYLLNFYVWSFDILFLCIVINSSIHCSELLGIGVYASKNAGRFHVSFHRTNYGRYSSPVTRLINLDNRYNSMDFYGIPHSRFIFDARRNWSCVQLLFFCMHMF